MKRGINPKTNGYSNFGRIARAEQKRKEGDERLEYWRSLTPQQQLNELDRRGVAAMKQRGRIWRQIEVSNEN